MPRNCFRLGASVNEEKMEKRKKWKKKWLNENKNKFIKGFLVCRLKYFRVSLVMWILEQLGLYVVFNGLADGLLEM